MRSPISSSTLAMASLSNVTASRGTHRCYGAHGRERRAHDERWPLSRAAGGECRRRGARGIRVERLRAPPASEGYELRTWPGWRGHFTSERRTLRSAEAALPASGSAAASEFEVVERCIDVAARAQFLGVLGGDRRT